MLNSADNHLRTIIDNVIKKLAKAKTQDQFTRICSSFAADCGLDYFMFGLCMSDSLIAPNMRVFDNLPNSWCEYYAEHNLAKIDPITSYCFSNTLPITWSQLVQRKEYKTPCAQRMIEMAAQYGMRSGLSIPIRVPSGAYGMLSLISHKPAEQTEATLLELLPYAQFIGGHLFDTVIRNRWLQDDKDGISTTKVDVKLTSRQYECLFWACEGKTSWEISKILAISERTTIFHLNNVTEKLGATNRQHAIAKALMLNMIKPNIYQLH